MNVAEFGYTLGNEIEFLTHIDWVQAFNSQNARRDGLPPGVLPLA